MRISTGNVYPFPMLPVGEFMFPFATKKWLGWTFNPPNVKMHTPDILGFLYDQVGRKKNSKKTFPTPLIFYISPQTGRVPIASDDFCDLASHPSKFAE
jgi:hypothetical protein